MDQMKGPDKVNELTESLFVRGIRMPHGVIGGRCAYRFNQILQNVGEHRYQAVSNTFLRSVFRAFLITNARRCYIRRDPLIRLEASFPLCDLAGYAEPTSTFVSGIYCCVR